MLTLLCCCGIAASAWAQAPAPANTPVVEFESALDTFFHESNGTLRLDTYVVAFLPQGPVKGEVAVMNSARKVVARFPFLAEAKARQGVFGRVQVQGPAEVKLTEPGLYNLIFVVAGKPVTSLAFVLHAIPSADEFNPQTTYRFEGLWSRFAHLTMRTAGEQQIPQLNLWVGQADLGKGKTKDQFHAELLRDGKLVAHSKRYHGHITPGRYQRTQIILHHPHDDKQSATAKAFALTDWLVDGPYELRLTRQSDEQVIRRFTFEVTQGKFKPHPRTDANVEPRFEHIVPRVARKGTNIFEMTEAIWLESK
ncbi:MAG: hypothetical protein WD042_12290 [Phycisphaeraceae bacterium]